MPDSVSKQKRSEVMAAVKQKDTRPELYVRSLLHKHGLRYRLHDKRLSGKPDLVFPSLKSVLFVNGCFWHGHPDGRCKLSRLPKSNTEFWINKVNVNRERDLRIWAKLRKEGWTVFVIWECQIGKSSHPQRVLHQLLQKRIRRDRQEVK